MSIETPHTLTLTPWDGNDYEGEEFGSWDDCAITCPHQPGTASMPCAVWEPCGCPAGTVGETDDPEELTGDWPCPASKTGTHRYIEGEPNRPTPTCWTRDWDMEISHTAFHLGLQAGTYSVRPWWDRETVKLELIDPLVATTP